MDIMTEADSNAMTECLDDDKPTTGTFRFYDSVFSAFFFVFELFSSFQWLAEWPCDVFITMENGNNVAASQNDGFPGSVLIQEKVQSQE